MDWLEVALHGVSVTFFLSCGLYMFSPFSLFPYHPALMCFGYEVLMGEAILFSRYIKTRKRKWWLQFHLVAQLSGYTLVLIAFVAIVYNKILNGKSHFESWHSWVGLSAFLITTTQILGGIAIYFFRKSLIKLGGVPFAEIGRASCRERV